MTTDSKGWHQGNALRQLIGTKEGAERDVSKLIGVSPQTIRLWKKEPVLLQRNIDKIVAQFGVTEEWLKTGKPPKYSTSGKSATVERKIDTALRMYEATIVRNAKAFALEIARIAAET